jgi:uncharacterized membrane protein
MRVNEGNLTDQISSTPSRAAETQRIQVDTAATAGAAGAAAGDSVNLSGLAGRISQTLQTLSNQSAQRAGRLQNVFRAGSYQPDTQQLAGAMLRA